MEIHPKGRIKKNSRKTDPKRLQISPRKCPPFYNEGRGRLRRSAVISFSDRRRRSQQSITRRKVLYLGLAEKGSFSLVTILTYADTRNANPLRTSLALGFHFFSTEKGKGDPLCVSANRQGRTKKKKITVP